MHALIREYREQRKILLNIETRLMGQMAPDYDNLCLIQKVEVFKYALSNTTGTDLYKVLWLKSPSSEVWLDRRCNFTRSLATMSMIGYILGLGDREDYFQASVATLPLLLLCTLKTCWSCPTPVI